MSEETYKEAVALVCTDGDVSVSRVQRKLRLRYNDAADIINRMEREGIISPSGLGGHRIVYATEESMKVYMAGRDMDLYQRLLDVARGAGEA